MRRIIVATHGELAKSLVETLELIAGTQNNIDYYCMTSSKSGAVGKKELEELIFSKEQSELIIFTDIIGGSVNNICSELLIEQQDLSKFHLISGVNLPMLLTVIFADSSSDISNILEASIKEAQNGIKYVNELLKGVIK